MSAGNDEPEQQQARPQQHEGQSLRQAVRERILAVDRLLETFLAEDPALEEAHNRVSASPSELLGYRFERLSVLVKNRRERAKALRPTAETIRHVSSIGLPPEMNRELAIHSTLIHYIHEQHRKELVAKGLPAPPMLSEAKDRFLEVAQLRAEVRNKIETVKRVEAEIWDAYCRLIARAQDFQRLVTANEGAKAHLPGFEDAVKETARAREQLAALQLRSQVLEALRRGWQEGADGRSLLDFEGWEKEAQEIRRPKPYRSECL